MEESLSQENLNKAERKALRRQEKEDKRIAAAQMKQRSKKIKQGIVVAIAALILASIGYIVINAEDNVVLDITKECVTHQGLAMHIHPHLSIVINGENLEIPADVGIASVTCMRPIHTHDTTGTLHVEYHRVRDFTLSEFFRVWGKEFSGQRILDYTVDEGHEIIVTVNGLVTEEYENLVLKDNDRIVIEYRERE